MDTYRSLIVVALVLAPLPAKATSVTFSFTNGGFGASAQFDQSGTDLIVTLMNTGTGDVMDPTDVLTAVFFNIAGSGSLTRVSAVVPATSEVYEIGTGTLATPGDRVVGGEWAYLDTYGLSSAGFGIFGPSDVFPGPDLVPPPDPDGVNFGLTSAGDNLLTANGGIVGQLLVSNAVVFTLGGYTGDPSADVSGAVFQYGTALNEPEYDGFVPEPTSFVLLGVGGSVSLGIFFTRRR